LLLSLSPSGATAAGAQFTLTVNGTNFASNALVLWNGSVRKTTFVNSTELQATIVAADILNEATDLVTVANPSATSAAQPFAVQSSTPHPTILAASLADTPEAGGGYALTVTGADFTSVSTVEWNNTPLTTTYVSPWQLSTVVTASDHATLLATVKVKNGTLTSNGFEVQ
jgi:hypothetical protein